MYSYPNCGFEVALLSGYELVSTTRGTNVRFADLAGLHRAIAATIVEVKRPLAKDEFRFLRKELNLSQRELAERLHVTEQTISLWERGSGTDIAFLADIALRQLACEALGIPTEGLTSRLNAARNLPRVAAPKLSLQLEYRNSNWSVVDGTVVERSLIFVEVPSASNYLILIAESAKLLTSQRGAVKQFALSYIVPKQATSHLREGCLVS